MCIRCTRGPNLGTVGYYLYDWGIRTEYEEKYDHPDRYLYTVKEELALYVIDHKLVGVRMYIAGDF
jgi:hypothetical protein